MNKSERTTGALVSVLYFVRMLGLFSVLPILTLAATDAFQASALVVGITLGIYGLCQAALQIPFGILSDRFGRRPVLMLGLMLFVAGSLLAATAESIQGVAIGRALQGAGAIAGVLLAVVADEVRFEFRSAVMAMIGASIAAAFGLSLIVGPFIYAVGGLSAVFYLAAITGCFAWVLVGFLPSSGGPSENRPSVPVLDSPLWRNGALQGLNLSIFLNHFLLMSSFLVIPKLLLGWDIPVAEHGWVYFGVLLGSFGLMLPAMIRWGKSGSVVLRVIPGILVMALGMLLLALSVSAWQGVTGLLVFFAGFNYLEASLPALVSKVAPESARGRAMGVYSTSQFLGIFVGGSLGGWLLDVWSLSALLLINALIAVIWMVMLVGLSRVPALQGTRAQGS